MAKVPEMSADFARWYTGMFMDNGTHRDERWKGVVETASNASDQTLEVLVRLAFEIAQAGGAKHEDLAGSYKSLLTSISGTGIPLDPTESKRELQFLAAAVLVRLFSKSADAALAVLTSSFNGTRKPELPMDLRGFAAKALIALAKKNHAGLDAGDISISTPEIGFVISEEGMETFDAEQWKTEVEALRDIASEAISSMVKQQNRIAERLSRQTTLAQEELQMLWWLMGTHSIRADKPFSKVDAAVRPILFAQELGDLTSISPGPASVAAILARAGAGEKPIRLFDTINALDVAIAEEVTASVTTSPVSTPMHFALEKRVEVGSTEAWKESWSAMTGLSSDIAMSGIKLAEQFYREHVLLNLEG